MLVKGAMSPTYLIRETLELAETYIEARDILINTKLIAGCYFISKICF